MIKLIIQYAHRTEFVHCDTFRIDYVFKGLMSDKGRLAIITFKDGYLYKNYYFDKGIQYFSANFR